MRVLVTGGAGFIGSALVRSFARDGHRVVVLDDLSCTGSTALLSDVLAGIELHVGDIRNPDSLSSLPAGGFDRVYHLAASFANARSIEHPELDRSTNVDGTRNVVDFALRRGCGLFVYTGSSSSYGAAPLPMREDGSIDPQTPYAHTKLKGETIATESPLSVAVLRLFNVCGAGDPPGRYRNVVPNMFAAAAAGRIVVTGAGATRDFTYIGDVVRALRLAERAEGTTVNVGTGIETPIEELAEQIRELSNRPDAEISVSPARGWDAVRCRRADLARLHELFGPVTTTPLEVALREAASWLTEGDWLGREVA